MLSTLPRIPRPTGALAVVNQASCTRVTLPPRGMTLNPGFVTNRTQACAKASAAVHMGLLLRSYLSTRTVMSSETAEETILMLHAEDKELYNACANVSPADGSLAPRPVAITLLAFGDEPDYCNAVREYLDALAHLAATELPMDDGRALAATRVRMSVMAGLDATWFVDKVSSQAVGPLPLVHNGEVAVCVRWAPPGDACGIRSEFSVLPSGRSLDECLILMQNYFLSLKVAHDVPFPASIAMVHSNVLKDTWATALHNASIAFFELMEGKTCVCKSKALREHEGSVNVGPVASVFLRICPRTVFNPATGQWQPIDVATARMRHDAFHAFLIGNMAYEQEIADYCKTLSASGMAADAELAHWCMHTCAVQANAFELRERISLYATHHSAGGRLPGLPICSPGSWIWRLESAIVPVEMVLQNFYVIPCHRDSVPPGDRKLEQPFNTFFSKAYRLFADTFGVVKKSVHEDFERLPLAPAVVPIGGDPGVREAEEYALTAFGLDASSRRITVGDAYALCTQRSAPKPLTNFMLQTSLRFGIGASLLDAMNLASVALDQRNAPEVAAHEAEGKRLRRLADAALHVSGSCKRLKPAMYEMPPNRVKLLLEASGLRIGQEAYMPLAKSAVALDYSDIVQVLGSCVLRAPAAANTHEHACEAAFQARSGGDMSSIASALTVLRSGANAVTGTVFLVSQESKDAAMGFARIGYSGNLEPVSPGAIINTPMRSVLLYKYSARGTRVTATLEGA